MGGMKSKIVMMIAEMLIAKLDPDDLRKWADAGLDLLEDKIAASETTLDDKMALPVINSFRTAFGIEDND